MSINVEVTDSELSCARHRGSRQRPADKAVIGQRISPALYPYIYQTVQSRLHQRDKARRASDTGTPIRFLTHKLWLLLSAL